MYVVFECVGAALLYKKNANIEFIIIYDLYYDSSCEDYVGIQLKIIYLY